MGSRDRVVELNRSFLSVLFLVVLDKVKKFGVLPISELFCVVAVKVAYYKGERPVAVRATAATSAIISIFYNMHSYVLRSAVLKSQFHLNSF